MLRIANWLRITAVVLKIWFNYKWSDNIVIWKVEHRA